MDRIKKISLGKHEFMETLYNHNTHQKASIERGQKLALTYKDRKGPIFYIQVDTKSKDNDTHTYIGTIYKFSNKDQNCYGRLKLGDTVAFCEDNVVNFQKSP